MVPQNNMLFHVRLQYGVSTPVFLPVELTERTRFTLIDAELIAKSTGDSLYDYDYLLVDLFGKSSHGTALKSSTGTEGIFLPFNTGLTKVTGGGGGGGSLSLRMGRYTGIQWPMDIHKVGTRNLDSTVRLFGDDGVEVTGDLADGGKVIVHLLFDIHNPPIQEEGAMGAQVSRIAKDGADPRIRQGSILESLNDSRVTTTRNPRRGYLSRAEDVAMMT